MVTLACVYGAPHVNTNLIKSARVVAGESSAGTPDRTGDGKRCFQWQNG